MKSFIKKSCALFIVLVVTILSSCTAQNKTTDEYMSVPEINHYVVEPDDSAHMTDSDKEYYRSLMDAVLAGESSVTLSDSKEKNLYYIDLLKQSPYYFFVDEYTLSDDTLIVTYKYSYDEQSQMLEFMDEKLLEITNKYAQPDDNDLDRLLKVYLATTHYLSYDHKRSDNKALSSPLLKYPYDEVYKALKDRKCLCHGFAYIFRFAVLQHNIDCFAVYGKFTKNNQAHMWNIFKFGSKFYTCDTSWDRANDEYSKLYNFGKTDDERKADNLTFDDFSSSHFAEYGDVKCTDRAFDVFRSVNRFSYISGHDFFIESFENEEYIFNTETMTYK